MAGCSDGSVRFYGPETGQLKRVLEGMHQTAVHAVAMSGDGERLYSGDPSGFFKVWQLGPQSHTMLAALKEHKVVSSAINWATCGWVCMAEDNLVQGSTKLECVALMRQWQQQ